MSKKKNAKIKNKKLSKLQKEKLEERTKSVLNTQMPLIESRKNHVACVICHESKGASLIYVDKKESRFRFLNNVYFLIPEGIYNTGGQSQIAIYLEGISLPLSHKNVDYVTDIRYYLDAEGNEHEVELTTIKNLKFDSKLLDILLYRGLVEKFAEQPQDKTIEGILILVAINIILSIVAVGVGYYF